MKNFTEYAELAIKRYGLTGYNNLARELDLNKATVSYFRAGKALPSESTMIKLAELAGLPKEEALIDLNMWRSKDKPELQKVWQRISKMIGCLLMFFCFLAAAKNAQCQELNLPSVSQLLDINYTLCDKFSYFIRLLCYTFDRDTLFGVKAMVTKVDYKIRKEGFRWLNAFLDYRNARCSSTGRFLYTKLI